MNDILNKTDAAEWVRTDDTDPALDSLMLVAYDAAEDSVDDFAIKLKSAKFKRKLKLFMLNYIVSAYERRGLEEETNGKMLFVNSTLLMQLQYGTYTEDDL